MPSDDSYEPMKKLSLIDNGAVCFEEGKREKDGGEKKNISPGSLKPFLVALSTVGGVNCPIHSHPRTEVDFLA